MLDGALYTLDIGANDILDALSNPSTADTVVINAAKSATAAVKELHTDGARNLLFYEVPNLGLTPDVAAQGTAAETLASSLAQLFNATVLGDLAPAARPAPTPESVRSGHLGFRFTEIVTNPKLDGFKKVSDPCWTGNFSGYSGGPNGKLCSKLPANAKSISVLGWGASDGGGAFARRPSRLRSIVAPEPSTWAMMLVGFAGLSFAGWRAPSRAPRSLTAPIPQGAAHSSRIAFARSFSGSEQVRAGRWEPSRGPGEEAPCMGNVWSSLILLLLLCASAGAGFFVNSRLPEEHRSRDSIELIQLANTLLVTFTAIVLGLLTTSVKAGFDAAYNARGDYAGQLAQMDRCLRDYGPRRRLSASSCAVTSPRSSPAPGLPSRPRQRRLSQYVEDAADRRKLGVSRADERYRSRSALDAADRHAAQEPHKRLRGAIPRPDQGPLAGDRGRARIDLDPLLLGAGVLARSSCLRASA